MQRPEAIDIGEGCWQWQLVLMSCSGEPFSVHHNKSIHSIGFADDDIHVGS